jgi:hypothetical protein
MLWPLDVFDAALSDLARFDLERDGKWSVHAAKHRMDAEQKRRACRRIGIPPLHLDP